MADVNEGPLVSDETYLYYVHGDHLGSSHVLTEGNPQGRHAGVVYNKGDILQRIEYAPFGQEKFVLNPNLSFGPRYTDQEYDIDSGLYYYNSRYYDPKLGRFLQPDTVTPDSGNTQSLNRYSYVKNNPLKYIDPTGHWGINIGYNPGAQGLSGEGFINAFGMGLNILTQSIQTPTDGPGERTWLQNEDYYFEYEGSDPSIVKQLVEPDSGLFHAFDEEAYREWIRKENAIEPDYLIEDIIAVVSIAKGISWAIGKTLSLAVDRVLFGPTTGRVFWSGGRLAEKVATTEARRMGGRTLGMTRRGMRLSNITKNMDWYTEARPLFLNTSKNFAKRASGDIHVFQNARGLAIDSIWKEELNVLMNNSKVDRIIVHIVY